MLKREPAILIAAAAAIVQGVVIYVTGDVSADASWAMPILTLLAGALTRRKVTPV